MKYIIFGAGHYGKLAISEIGASNVDFFMDNDKKKKGTIFCGKPVILPSDAWTMKDKYHILVASVYSVSMLNQLRELGFTDFSVYIQKIYGFYDTEELIVNPYEKGEESKTEEEWSETKITEYTRKAIYDEAETLYNSNPLFNHVEVETINRCNGICSFCPVNRSNDPREKAVMSIEMFENIVGQLEAINYIGRFTTFSNNEPLLDDRIIDFNKYARKHLSGARMHLFTNGTLLTLDKFKELVSVLDELVIDNYQQELKLIKPCIQIADYCEEHPELKRKVTIVLRKPYEILTSRGGSAPNRCNLKEYGDDRCVYPFKQLIIRPTGQVSLCCNDALGKYTLGDLKKEKILDIWYGDRFKTVRQCLYEGRRNWGNCKYCDTFSVG